MNQPLPPRRPVRKSHPVGFTIDSPSASDPRPRLSQQQQNARKALPKWKRVAIHIIDVIVVCINSCAALALIVSAYAQRINPEFHSWASIVAMSFGFCFWGVLVLFIIDLFWWRRTAWIVGLAMLGCVGQINSYMPLNLPHLGMSASQKERAFSVLTYNVGSWQDNEDKDVGYNRQLDYILKQNADIVCIQEARFLSPTAENLIKQSQLDSMHRAYPYVMTQGNDFAIMSKFPIEPINLDFPSANFASGGMAAWRAKIYGEVVNIFSVHLRSFSLTSDDKTAYEDIVKMDARTKAELLDARTSILPKVGSAGKERAQQIAYLQKYLQRYGGKNALVVGDFNDTENSYGIYKLCTDSHMRQAFENAGFGAAHTFHDNYFFFRIDHILYRGQMEPYSIKCPSIKASDHYPLKAVFIMDEK